MVFDGHPSTRIFAVSKRILDVAGALVLLILSFPVIIAASVAIKREDGWGAPLFYRQTRVGAGGKSFELIKFRSMRVDAESDGKAVWASRNDDRVTNVGRILRKTRIDEIPQLFNVLRGSMSLVGPRPERPHFVAELEKCVPYYAERHRIKPGVTGWAQLMYPYGASREDAREKLQYDLYYLKHRSLMLDLVILLQTVEVVLFGKGAR
jgi:exopolysaccharide biosynthesis polyprenyl glycosylphosphotransferase